MSATVISPADGLGGAARRYYAAAEPGIALLDKRGRFAVEVAARVYDPARSSGPAMMFERRAVVPRRKVLITARTRRCRPCGGIYLCPGNATMFLRALRSSSVAAFVFTALNYALFYWKGVPLVTEMVAEWIMARTPNYYAVVLLTGSATGPSPSPPPASWLPLFVFLSCAALALLAEPAAAYLLGAELLARVPFVMLAGRRASQWKLGARPGLRAQGRRAVPLWPFHHPEEREQFAPGRVTSVDQFTG